MNGIDAQGMVLRRRLLTVGAVVGAFALMLPILMAVAADAGGSVRVADNHRLGSDPGNVRGRDVVGLAADPTDPRHIVAVNYEFVTGNCEYQVTFDGGRLWAGGSLRASDAFPDPACPVNNHDLGGRPAHGVVAFGSGDNVYTVWPGEEPDGSDSILLAKSSDAGRSFAEAIVAIPAGANTDYRRPKLLVVPSSSGDRVYVTAWASPNGFSRQIVVARSSDGATTFGDPVVASSPTHVAIDNSQPVATGDGLQLVYRFTSGSGSTNSLWLATSDDGGATWTQTQVRSGFNPARGFIDPKLASDTVNDALYLAYAESPGGGSPGDVFFQRSTDGGVTWSDPLQINDDPGDAEQIDPWLTVASEGRIDLVWYDRRHEHPGPDLLEDVYYAWSTDHGETFSQNRRITDRTNSWDVGYKPRLGVFPPVAVPVDDGLMVAWADSREGSFHNDNQDIYLAQVGHAPDGLPPVGSLSGDGIPLAVAASQLAYPGGVEDIDDQATTTIVVVNDGAPGLALAGGVLARDQLGPVLPSPARGLPEHVSAEVARLEAVAAFVIGDETELSEQVIRDLVAAGVPEDAIVRMAGESPADTARLVAQRLDPRSDFERAQGRPAFPDAVIVNPHTPEAVAAANLAAARRLPVLFVNRDEVEGATRQAVDELDIDRTLVVGGHGAISDKVMDQLPSPTRLAGQDVYSTSAAVATESTARGLPINVVYLSDGRQSVEVAAAGAAIARLGGLLLLVPDADREAAMEVLASGDVGTRVDRMVTMTTPDGRPGRSYADPDAPVADPADGAAPPDDLPTPATGDGLGVVAVLLLLASGAAADIRRRRPPSNRHGAVLTGDGSSEAG